MFYLNYYLLTDKHNGWLETTSLIQVKFTYTLPLVIKNISIKFMNQFFFWKVIGNQLIKIFCIFKTKVLNLNVRT